MDKLPPELCELILLRVDVETALFLIKGGISLPGLQDRLHLDLWQKWRYGVSSFTKCEHIMLVGKTFTRLQKLILGSGGCAGGHAYLSNLKNLRVLNVAGSPITDRCLHKICASCPLEDLDIKICPNLRDFSSLLRLDNLKRLNVYRTKFSLEDLKAMCRKFKDTLEYLKLWSVDNGDFSHKIDRIKWNCISSLTKLRELDTPCPISERWMRKLTNLSDCLEILKLTAVHWSIENGDIGVGIELLCELRNLRVLLLRLRIRESELKIICKGAKNIEDLSLYKCLILNNSGEDISEIANLLCLRHFRMDIYTSREIKKSGSDLLDRLENRGVKLYRYQ